MAHRWSFWMAPLDHRGIRVLDDLYRGWLTPMGQALLWATVAFGMLQRGLVSELLVIGFGFSAGALASAALVGLPFRPRVELQRHMPPPRAAGELLTYRVTVRNTGRRTARQILVQERQLPGDLRMIGEPPVISQLGPGEQATVRLSLLCKARGAFQLRRLQAASTFPAGLWKWPRRGAGQQGLLVYPRMARVDQVDIPLGRHFQPGGITFASRVGDSTEFHGTRDWRPGDRVRDIHWPSFARTGQPIVKDFQEEYFVRVAVIIDTEVRVAREEVSFEHGLSFVAGLAETLARRDAIVDLVAVGTTVHRFMAGRAIAQVDNVLEILACIEPDNRFDAASLGAEILPEVPRMSAVCLMLTRWDEKRARLVEDIRSCGTAVRVLLLNPGREAPPLRPEELLVL